MEPSKQKIITSENELPPGRIISASGDELEILEKYRKEILIWDVSKNDKYMVKIYALRSAFRGNSLAQVTKNINDAKKYRIISEELIENNVLSTLYDRRTATDTQKATSDDSIVVGKFHTILSDALFNDVSDIHIEVRPIKSKIRMRKDGELRDFVNQNESSLDYTETFNLCSVLYNVLATTKSVSFDPRDCQQAAINYTIGDTEIKLRYQSVPAYPDGFDVVLRVLPIGRSEEFVPLQKLGYTEQQVEELINITARPVGSLFIAGVTGSGKSTTLKNLLMYINAHAGFKIKIYSIEDPPEYNIARITQIPVVIPKDFEPTKDVSPFEKPIKACMRADPDIIMIGEIRDVVTGDLTKKAVQSGHQVLTTIHTTSALGVIERLIDFGLSRSVLGSPDFLTGLVYQKLLPKVCEHCAIDFNKLVASGEGSNEDQALYNRINDNLKINITNYNLNKRNPNGCEKCDGTGIKGRSVCAEVIMLDLNMLELITSNDTIGLIKYWRSMSDKDVFSNVMKGKTCMEHGFKKVLDGLVCPYDLEKDFKPLSEMKLEKIMPSINISEGKQEKTNGWADLD